MSENDETKCEMFYADGRCFASQRNGIGYPYHKSEYCEYNSNCYYKQLQQLKQENEELKEQIKSNSFGMFNIQMAQCLDEIEEVARTLGNQNDVKCRLNDRDIQKLLEIDDDLLSDGCILRKHILQLIKQVKEGSND